MRRVLLSLFAVVLLTIEMLDLALGRGGLSGRFVSSWRKLIMGANGQTGHQDNIAK